MNREARRHGLKLTDKAMLDLARARVVKQRAQKYADERAVKGSHEWEVRRNSYLDGYLACVRNEVI